MYTYMHIYIYIYIYIYTHIFGAGTRAHHPTPSVVLSPSKNSRRVTCTKLIRVPCCVTYSQYFQSLSTHTQFRRITPPPALQPPCPAR